MQPHEEIILWSHGSRFKIRYLPQPTRMHKPGGYGDEVEYITLSLRVPSYILFGPRGYIGRLSRRQLRPWANYFGLQYLRTL